MSTNPTEPITPAPPSRTVGIPKGVIRWQSIGGGIVLAIATGYFAWAGEKDVAIIAGLMLLNHIGITGQNAALAGMIASAVAHRHFGTPAEAHPEQPIDVPPKS